MKKKFLDLGTQPIANSFLTRNTKKAHSNEFFYNLSVSFDRKNFLVSVTNPVNPKIQYTNKYPLKNNQYQDICKISTG